MSEEDCQKNPQLNSWFVIWTESRAEKKVEGRIAALGLSPWLPTVTERHRWSDRWRDVVVPFFPGYLFARVRNAEWHKVLRTPGVLTIVKHEGKVAMVDDELVVFLKRVIEQGGGLPLLEVPEFKPGDQVMIVQEGPLKGVRGVVRGRRNARQLVIWVEQIGRGIALTIGSTLVKAAA